MKSTHQCVGTMKSTEQSGQSQYNKMIQLAYYHFSLTSTTHTVGVLSLQSHVDNGYWDTNEGTYISELLTLSGEVHTTESGQSQYNKMIQLAYYHFSLTSTTHTVGVLSLQSHVDNGYWDTNEGTYISELLTLSGEVHTTESGQSQYNKMIQLAYYHFSLTSTTHTVGVLSLQSHVDNGYWDTNEGTYISELLTLSGEVHTTESGQSQYNEMIQLAYYYFSLTSTMVIGIPMKVS